MDELVEAFLIESRENLEQLDQDLLLLEADPRAQEPVASAFRALHTIKGTCAFFGFPQLERLSHAAENLLGALRDGDCRATPDVVTVLLGTSDRLAGIISHIEVAGSEPDEANEALHDQLRAAMEPAVAAVPVAAEAVVEAAVPAPVEPAVPAPVEPAVPAPLEPAAPAAGTDTGTAPPPENGTAPPGSNGTAPPAAATGGGTLRVGVGVLDQLMGLVGELVLARNQLQQHDQATLGPVAPVAERIDQITVGLQETATTTRMQPVRNVFAKLPRTARDVAYATAKDVQLLTEGEETELDRTVLEAIRDPLTHLVRNAVDHGIEDPETRRQAGKSPQGTVRVRATQAGDRVIIEVIDDGAGIDADRLRDTAVERGVISRERAGKLGRREVLDLIFSPGFSTATTVTNVSGRGVGMDVVRTNVEDTGGSVEIDSEPGAGSTVRLSLPLTLAIITAMVVSSGGQLFALPQSDVEELLQLSPTSANRLERMHTSTVVRHRDRLLPVVELATLLGLPSCDASADATIALMRTDAGSFGVVLDAVRHAVEIVVKPLHPEIRQLGWYSASTILGDGTVVLILDANALARTCEPVADGHSPTVSDPVRPPAGGDVDRYLVATHGEDAFAVPVDRIDRIEEVRPAQVEWVGDVPLLQSRDEVVRLHGRLEELTVGTATSFVAVVLRDTEPTAAVCLPSIDRIARGALHTDEGFVITEGRAAQLLTATGTSVRGG